VPEPFSSIGFAFLLPYLIGSVPVALWLGYLVTGRDIRQQGSGNVGATNAWRLQGWELAVVVFLLDALKGVVAVFLVRTMPSWFLVPAALLVLIGHRYPVFAGFRGGKGASTSLGILLAMAWHVGLAVAFCYGAVLAWKRVSGVATLVAASLGALFAGAMGMIGWMKLPEIATVWCCTVFLWFSHRENLSRLVKKEAESPGS